MATTQKFLDNAVGLPKLWDIIKTNFSRYSFASVTDGTTTLSASKDDSLTVEAGSNVTVALSSANDTKKVTISATDTTYSDVTADSTGAAASGLMTSDDKYKLDNIAAGGQVNVLESVKVNGTALTVDSNKAVDVLIQDGTSTEGYGKIKVNGFGVAVYGLGTAGAATVETTGVSSNTTTLPTTAQVKTYVEGLMVSALTDGDTSHVPTADAVYDAIGSAVASAYIYKGSVATEQDLPSTGNTTGDVYNIVAASTYGEAGMNVAWNGSAWDALGGSIIMTAMTATEVEGICTFSA